MFTTINSINAEWSLKNIVYVVAFSVPIIKQCERLKHRLRMLFNEVISTLFLNEMELVFPPLKKEVNHSY